MWNKINGYYLDKEQEAIVRDNSKYLLVVAGAGSGKTQTILGKIGYLIQEKNIASSEILCISFTKKASLSLSQKIKREFDVEVPVYTFHKLAISILKEKYNYKITNPEILKDIIHLFFYETIFSYPNQMEMVLKYFNISRYKNIKKEYRKLIDKNEKSILLLEYTILTFINLFKCNNYDLSDFKKFFNRIKLTLNIKKYIKEKYFLLLTLNIYLLYTNYLENNDEIDFNDIIIKATNLIEHSGYNKNIKYVIIDEYQDTSLVRFNLIKEILNSTNSKLMVVGDDFQSIYRFTGCDINLFINFKKYFSNAKIMKIQTTYRNSDELIKVAGRFVMKNRMQIKKNLKSNKYLKNPIRIIYYSNIREEFKKLINSIYNNSHGNILVLGRNNNDVNMILDNELKIDKEGNITYLKNKNIKINYMTIHKSKGLESDNVIMINLIDNKIGLPSKIENEKILRLVSINNEKYPYSEERRLFYVGLTRTKNSVYLLCPRNKCSIFITELKNML